MLVLILFTFLHNNYSCFIPSGILLLFCDFNSMLFSYYLCILCYYFRSAIIPVTISVLVLLPLRYNSYSVLFLSVATSSLAFSILLLLLFHLLQRTLPPLHSHNVLIFPRTSSPNQSSTHTTTHSLIPSVVHTLTLTTPAVLFI